MKNELGITKGEWMILDTGEFESTIYANQIRIADVKSFGDGFNDATFQERLENEKLIAEAGTVANETGKTPRQLADDNKVLLEALKEMIRTVNPTDVTPNKVSMGVSLGEYYVGGCSFPSNKSIHMAINAIKQVTE